MTLADLGFPDCLAHFCAEGTVPARVMAVDRDRFTIDDGMAEHHAALSGRFAHDVAHDDAGVAAMPCVGDWVCATVQPDGPAIIHALVPRRTFLRRKAAGKAVEHQYMAANVDVAFIVQSCHFDFNVRRLERYLVMVREGHVTPHILLTKTDLVSADGLALLLARIREAGIEVPVTPLSNLTGEGVGAVKALMQKGRTHVLLGSSGVGKTTLINALCGTNDLATGDVSGTGEGRHTTTRRHMIVLDNGALLIDMPGMRELGLLGSSEGVAETFEDIVEMERQCRFSDCRHENEPGCAIRIAIAAGDLREERLAEYRKLEKETRFHDLSHAERRKKDRDFGKMVKSIVKHNRK